MPYCALCEARVDACPHLSRPTHRLPDLQAPARPMPATAPLVEHLRDRLRDQDERGAELDDWERKRRMETAVGDGDSPFELSDVALSSLVEETETGDEDDVIAALAGNDVVAAFVRSRGWRRAGPVRAIGNRRRALPRSLPPSPARLKLANLHFGGNVPAGAVLNMAVQVTSPFKACRLVFPPMEGVRFMAANVGLNLQEHLPEGGVSTLAYPPYPEEGDPPENIEWDVALTGMIICLSVRNVTSRDAYVSAVVRGRTIVGDGAVLGDDPDADGSPTGGTD